MIAQSEYFKNKVDSKDNIELYLYNFMLDDSLKKSVLMLRMEMNESVNFLSTIIL